MSWQALYRWVIARFTDAPAPALPTYYYRVTAVYEEPTFQAMKQAWHDWVPNVTVYAAVAARLESHARPDPIVTCPQCFRNGPGQHLISGGAALFCENCEEWVTACQ